VCRDPKDNFLLALAKDGLADYLITGDRDLLSVKKFGKTQIVTLNEFEKILND
jgi:predicted nucleic acid-binding protein